jgi:HB1, ASXL, restriction endonuclease HTH domain
MADPTKASNPYESALIALRAKRAEIDQAIATLEGLAGSLPPSLATVDETPDDTTSSEGMFLGMSLGDATKKLLSARKKALTTSEILDGLRGGGVVFTGQTPSNSIGTVLHRLSRPGKDVVSVSRGVWGLKEWYPNRFKKEARSESDEKDDEEINDETNASAQPLRPTLVSAQG